MAAGMQDFFSRRATARAGALAAAALFAVVLVTGAATAQEGSGQPQAQAAEPPQDLFGSLPEPPTDSGPPPAVLDQANPDHLKLQQPGEAFGALPPDGRGRPDWVRSLREGLIQPRSTVQGDPDLQLLELDVVMQNTAQMPYVKFPHGAHTQWLACTNCHDGLFVPKAGANPTTMPKILAGESCGVCHSKVAFTAMYTCERCHSVPQPGQKPWW
jgi:c(7)-type cytochrome triheme protein